MLPLWWPRSACIYCGHPLFHPPGVIRWAKSKGVPASARTRGARPERLACLAHRDLVPLDPHLPAVTATLETLLERGEVECCYLLLRGDFTAHELDLIRRAFEDGVRIGRELEAMDAAMREHEDGHR